jgi:hypothetical protein
MYQQVIVEPWQSLLDVALRYCGDAAAMYDIAVANGVSLMNQPFAGATLLVPTPTTATAQALVKSFAAKKGLPASMPPISVSMPRDFTIDYISDYAVS